MASREGRNDQAWSRMRLQPLEPGPNLKMKRIPRAALYVAQVLTVGAVLFFSLELWRKDLHVPFEVTGDSLFWTVMVEAVHEDGWGERVSRLGMPVGADLMDWPMGMPLDFGAMSLLRGALGSPGAALNVYWLLSLLATGLSATLCFRWLRFAPSLAFGLGTLYALLPFGFWHHTRHIPLVFHFVPMIAFLALRVGEGDRNHLSRGQRLTALAACFMQGLGIVYYSFFSCILLGAAAVVGWMRTRQAAPARTAVVAVALLCTGTLMGLAPSLRYWQAHGRNPELSYKSPAEADTYGLRIRNLLTPIPDHPIPAVRGVAEAVKAARFPEDGEALGVRLGALGSIGFILLLGFSVGAVAGAFPGSPSLLRSAAALTLISLLVAQVGGFGSLFSVFVAPDIRVYGRIVVFIAFFSLVAVGVALSGLVPRLGTRSVLRAGLAGPGLTALILAFVFDQVSTTRLVAQYEDNATRYERERAFVARVESMLPRGGMVLQLPHSEVPVETRRRRPMALYDHGWSFVHSRSLRWSWGGIRGRNGDWPREVAFLPPRALVSRAARAGFVGIWVDRFGYADRGARLIPRLAEAAASDPVESEDGRFALVSLVLFQHRLEADLGAVVLEQEREEALRAPLVPRWGTGCGEEVAGQNGRWCGPTARLFLKNTLDAERRVTLRARIKGPPGGELAIDSVRFSDAVGLGERAVAWERYVVLRPRERLRIDLGVEASGGEASRVQVLDLRVSEDR